VKLLRGILLTLLITTAIPAYAVVVEGSFSTMYEHSKYKGDSSEGTWENTLILDNVKLINPYLGFNFHGSYSIEDGENYTDIYSAYLHFKNFEDALEIKLGRFSFLGNRFLTLDGIEATLRTDYKFGVSVFAGSPEFYDSDDRAIKQTFRDAGDRLYGGRIFLNGVKNTSAYISYSKEEDDDRTIQELVGFGLGRVFVLNEDTFITVDGKLDYDQESNDLYRGIARVFAKHKKFAFSADASRIRVEDGSERFEELVITTFSDGKQDRYSYTLEYAINNNYKVYHSLVHSVILDNDGRWETGEIIKFGLNIDHFKTHGLTSEVEFYIYESDIAEATGGSFNIDWNITRELSTSFSAEYVGYSQVAGLDREKDVYSIYADLEYDILRNLSVNLYAENSKETRFLPENRYGVKFKYFF
jgi:hypothetical protein